MRLSLTVLLVALLIPAAVSSQSLAPDSQPEAVARDALVSTSSSRLGITVEPRNGPLMPVADTIPSCNTVGSRIANSLVGGLGGALLGAVIGAGTGAYIDGHNSNDATVSAIPILGIYGAIAGAGLGLIVGAFWPVH